MRGFVARSRIVASGLPSIGSDQQTSTTYASKPVRYVGVLKNSQGAVLLSMAVEKTLSANKPQDGCGPVCCRGRGRVGCDVQNLAE